MDVLGSQIAVKNEQELGHARYDGSSVATEVDIGRVISLVSE